MSEGESKSTKDGGVLGSLPSTRPNRLGRRRDAAPADGAPASAPKPAPAAKPKAKAKPAARKPKAAAASGEAKRATPKARMPGTTRGTPNPAPRDRSDQGGPEPVRAGAPALKADAPEDRGPEPQSGPSGTELVTTVVQAAGELAKIGLTVGGQVLKRTVDKLPRP